MLANVELAVVSDINSFIISNTLPEIPEGIYELESASYTEKTPGVFGSDFFSSTFNQTYNYIHGLDASGCTYYAIWSETYIINAFGIDAYSLVLSQRAK